MVAAATAASTIVLLHGLVTVAPSAACQATPGCAKPAAHVALKFVRTHETSDSALAIATTDARGRYRVSLAPGTWIVQGLQGQLATPMRILVPNVRSLTRNFRLDAGNVR